jgi:hypothetical protein
MGAFGGRQDDRRASRARRRFAWLTVAASVAIGVSVAPASPVAAAPSVTITAAPKPFSRSTSATFRWTVSPARVAVQCRLDTAAFASCPGGKKAFSRLSQGAHRFQLRFRSGGKLKVVSRSWTIDTAKPVDGAVLPQEVRGRSLDLIIVKGRDRGSGVATWSLMRRVAPVANGVCGRFGTAQRVGKVRPSSPVTDSNLPASGCVNYELVVKDKAGNSATFRPTFGSVIVDSSAPQVTMNTLPSLIEESPFTISGTVSDAQSGVESVLVENRRSVGLTVEGGVLCRATVTGSTWSCEAFRPDDGTWTISATARNKALRESTATQTGVQFRSDESGVRLFTNGLPMRVIEGRHTSNLSVVLEAAPFSDVTVTFADGKEVAMAPSSLTFTPSNWFTPRTVVVSAVQDAVVEPTETEEIIASTSSADTDFDGLTSRATYTILDDDSPAVFVHATTLGGVIRESGLTTTRQVSLGAAPTANVSMTFASDKPGVTFSPSKITFTPSNFATPQTLTIRATDDGIAEGTIIHTISANVVSDDTRYDDFVVPTFTVTEDFDNDRVDIVFTISGFSTEVFEGGATDTLGIRLGSTPTANVTLALTRPAACAADATFSPTTMTFTPANALTDQTLTITAVNDALVEGFESCAVIPTATSADPAYNGFTMPGFGFIIFDND